MASSWPTAIMHARHRPQLHHSHCGDGRRATSSDAKSRAAITTALRLLQQRSAYLIRPRARLARALAWVPVGPGAGAVAGGMAGRRRPRASSPLDAAHRAQHRPLLLPAAGQAAVTCGPAPLREHSRSFRGNARGAIGNATLRTGAEPSLTFREEHTRGQQQMLVEHRSIASTPVSVHSSASVAQEF